MQQTRNPKRVPDLRASGRFSKAKKTLMLLTMVAPGAIWLLLLRYLPMGGIILAFKNYKIYPKDPTFLNNLIHSKWVGLDNFKFLFTTGDSWVMIRNTLAYNIVFIVLGVIIPVAFAIMMNEITRKFFKKAYQTMMFFPYFLSWVVVSYFLNAFLDAQYGMIPAMQEAAGHARTSWYTTPGPWPFILTFANLWKNVGYSTVLYLAAITGIDTNQYEAAAMDGATKWQQVLHVTIPHLRTMIAILFIMNVGKIFASDFGLFYNVPMQNGALFSGTIAQNLRWGNANATQEQLREACAIACADEFIDRFPGGYETVLEQNAANLSGGQKQRLRIARAIVKQPKILILDDSTSAVDMATDEHIRRALKTAMPGSTKIIIAQRIASILSCDRIIVLHEGELSDVGTHAELMERSQIYRDVYDSQMREEGEQHGQS